MVVVRRFLLLSVLAAASGANAAAAPAIKVWAIGDYARIDPLSGKAIEYQPLLFPDTPAGDYTESNLVWNGASRTISLKAARNEVTAFQIVVERTAGTKLTNVNIKLGDLAGPGGK